MKMLLVLSLIAFGATVSQAAVYDCTLSSSNPDEPVVAEFTIDTVQEHNKFVELEDGSAVGCVVFRSTPELLACGWGSGEKFSTFATSDVGSSVLSVRSAGGDLAATLACVNQH